MDVWRSDAAVKAVIPLPVLAEGLDTRAGEPFSGSHDSWVGVYPADVNNRLFRLASGAGSFSLGEAADADGAAPTLLLVPRALAGGAPGVLFGRSEIWQWLKCVGVDPTVGSGLSCCPLSRRPYATARAGRVPPSAARVADPPLPAPSPTHRPHTASSGTAAAPTPPHRLLRYRCRPHTPSRVLGYRYRPKLRGPN